MEQRTNMLSIKEVKKKSRAWSASQWEIELRKLETKQREVLISSEGYKRLAEQHCLWRGASETKENSLVKILKEEMKKLPKEQKTILQMIFWEGMTETAINNKLKISKHALRYRKAKYLRELKKKIARRVATKNLLVEGNFFISGKKEAFCENFLFQKNTNKRTACEAIF